MGALGPVFGVLFYLLVIIAAISSAISLMEVVGAFAIDNAAKKGKQVDRTKVTLIVSGLILIEALLVAVDGLGSTGIFRWKASAMWNDCMLDFMDCWSEGVAMPVGAMLMSLMISLELKPKFILDGDRLGRRLLPQVLCFCITIVCPLVMALVTAGQFIDFFVGTDDGMDAQLICYAAAAALLVASSPRRSGPKNDKRQHRTIASARFGGSFRQFFGLESLKYIEHSRTFRTLT